jgi:CHAT domain-containing protein
LEPANPLLLAGLALAGAAHRSQMPVEREDGILTAEEVACMNLHGVECVVLSSCKTGVGPVESSEGVLSLCRAFQIAGARTLVMSLWSVSDAHTRSWMRAFYTSALEDGLGVVGAARAANVTVLASLRRAGASTHPFYWGGFVTTGDWK